MLEIPAKIILLQFSIILVFKVFLSVVPQVLHLREFTKDIIYFCVQVLSFSVKGFLLTLQVEKLIQSSNSVFASSFAFLFCIAAIQFAECLTAVQLTSSFVLHF